MKHIEAAEFWEKAFKGLVTFLMAIGVAVATAVLKSNQEMQVKLARIESTMPTKEDLASMNSKIFAHETRILTVELTCRKLNKNL